MTAPGEYNGWTIYEGTRFTEALLWPDISDKTGYGARMDVRKAQTPTATAILGLPVGDGLQLSVATVQTMTITGSPTGGTIRLSGPTATIAYNASAATVQTEIRALGGAYATATVTGSAGGPWTVTIFDATALTLHTNSLTGGTSPSLTIANASYLCVGIDIPATDTKRLSFKPVDGILTGYYDIEIIPPTGEEYTWRALMGTITYSREVTAAVAP